MPSVNLFSQAVFQWISQNSTVFLPEAWRMYQALSVLYICIFGCVFAFDSLVGYRAQSSKSALKVLTVMVLVGFGLKYYAAPTPVLGGYSVHQLIPQIGMYLANILNTSSLNACIAQLDKLIGAQHPPTWHSPWMQIICYALLAALVWLLQGLMLLLTIVGYVFIAAGIVFGPLIIASKLIPIGWVQELTPMWFRYLFNWSMFQAVGAVVVSIWSSMMLFVLNAMFHGVYTGIDIIWAVKLLIVVNIAFAFIAWRVERIAQSLFGGAHGAEGFGSFLKGSFF